MRDVAMPMQDSLPAGWLTFAERELNPLGRDERFPNCYISSHFPGFILTRREFIALIGGAVAWPLPARAQQPEMPVIGYLHSGSPSPYAHLVAAFRQGLKEVGYIEGQNVKIEYRWAEGRYDHLPALVAELLGRRVALIVTQGGDPPPVAAKSATLTIPIVFTCSSDPVKLGLVDSLNRPAGNVTGYWAYTSLLGTKRLELIRQLLPANTSIGVLVNPNNPNAQIDAADLQEAARTLGQSINFVSAGTETEITAAFSTLSDQRISALLVNTDPFFLARRDQFVFLAALNAVPTIYAQQEFVAAGGLVSYGASLADGYRQVGVYAGRILKGEKPADLPVVQPTRFEMAINIKTAKTLGLNRPRCLP
jgi:putative tryptophan/tyrosine transport system substrate-binding protein